MTSKRMDQSTPSGGVLAVDAVELVRQALDRISFGVIQLTIHQDRLVQIDITERQRFPAM